MMFPLHAESKSAAQAALAAQAMGHFREMHDLLFAQSPNHSHEDCLGYAKQIWLDLSKFEAAYQAAAARVDADQEIGRGLGVNSTPTIFFNDRKYEGPLNARYLGLWVEEEL